MKRESAFKGPKTAVEFVSREVGGVVGATTSVQLPRNEKQVTNVKHSMNCTQDSDAGADHLFIVMQEAYTQDHTNSFVCDVRTAPDPAIVLAYDH